MKKIIFIIFVIIVILIAGYQFLKRGDEKPILPVVDPATKRLTSTGSVMGFREDNSSHAWLGIPFAKAPVGKLRWRAPRPAEKWEGTRKALTIGSVCTQYGGQLSGVPRDMYGKIVGVEDCLYLNIWAPAFRPEKIPTGDDRLPVMVWIHGGGNSIGHGGSYSGKTLAARYKVIVVTFNYRLGPLGWFTHPALRGRETTHEDRSGNYGTLDIIRALTWVKINIALFGGNPKNITVFGESAGGRNTVSMLLSPRAKGLFHRAIVQSGAARTDTVAAAENYRDAGVAGHYYSSREVINRLLIADKTAPDRKAARTYQDKMSDREIAEYLHGKSSPDILSVYKAWTAGMIYFPNLFQDGVVLARGDSLKKFKSTASYNAVPVILGTNRDEFKLFMAQNPEYVNRYFKVFVRIKDQELYKLVARYRSDAWKAFGADEIAAVLRKTQGPSVYVYRFDWDEEPSLLGMDMGILLGAAHGLEIPFVFNNFSSGLGLGFLYTEDNRKGREALSDSMSSYWAQFAYSGFPGRGRGGKEIEWKTWDNSPESDKFIIFDTSEGGGIRMSSNAITRRILKKRILAETGFTSREKHCETYVKIFRNTELWDGKEYENLGEGCGKYPAEQFRGF
jgi:para-nitrobenzyl esterase